MNEATTVDEAGKAKERRSSKTSEANDFLKAEYASLLTLYTHTENTIFNVFNFYLTFLSAIGGAIIVLVQINSANPAVALPSVSGLLAFAILVGIITQDAIVNKNIELSLCALALNRVKYRQLLQWPDIKPYLFYLHNTWAPVTPFHPKVVHLSRRVHERWWWLFSLGTHQLFIGVIDSFALAALTLIAVELLTGSTLPLSKLIIGEVAVTALSFEMHAIYARLKHRRSVENFITASGEKPAW